MSKIEEHLKSNPDIRVDEKVEDPLDSSKVVPLNELWQRLSGEAKSQYQAPYQTNDDINPHIKASFDDYLSKEEIKGLMKAQDDLFISANWYIKASDPFEDMQMCCNYYYALKANIDNQDTVIMRMHEESNRLEKETLAELNELTNNYKTLFLRHAEEMKTKIPDGPQYDKIR